MLVSICQKCGQPLKPGSLRYQVTIELVSMFDGYIEETEEMSDEHIEKLLQSISKKDPGELMNDVVQTISLVVCRSCRNNLVKIWDVDNKKVMH